MSSSGPTSKCERSISRLCVHACFADCVSDNKDAVQSTERDAASLAVDGNANTYSCTLDARSYPWWVVDLGQDYSIISVEVTLPNVGGDDRNYHSLCSAYQRVLCQSHHKYA